MRSLAVDEPPNAELRRPDTSTSNDANKERKIHLQCA